MVRLTNLKSQFYSVFIIIDTLKTLFDSRKFGVSAVDFLKFGTLNNKNT